MQPLIIAVGTCSIIFMSLLLLMVCKKRPYPNPYPGPNPNLTPNLTLTCDQGTPAYNPSETPGPR